MKRHKHVTLQLLWEEYHGSPRHSGAALQLVLRTVSALGAAVATLDAPTSLCRRETLRRLRRRTVPIYGATCEEAFRAAIFVGALGASGYAYAEATRTATLPDWLGSHVRMLEFYGASPDHLRARQSAGRRDQGGSLRAGAAALVRGNGRAFWDRGDPGTAVSAEGQTESGAHGIAGVPLDPRAAAPSTLLQLGRAQCRDPPAARSTERPAVPETAGITPLDVRVTRPAGDARVADHPVRVCRVEARARRLRLPRRDRPPLLQHPACARRAGALGALHRHHGRGVPLWPAGQQSCAILSARCSHDGTSAHAEIPSRACAVDADATHPLGCLDRHEHRRGGRASPQEQDPSGARIPGLPGATRVGAAVREWSARGGEHLGREATKSEPQKRAVDPEDRARPAPGRPPPKSSNSTCPRTRTCAARSTTTDPDPHTRSHHVDDEYLGNTAINETARHGAGPRAPARDARHPRARLRGTLRLARRSGALVSAERSLPRAAARGEAQSLPRPASRTSATSPDADSRSRRSPRSPMARGSSAARTYSSRGRPGRGRHGSRVRSRIKHAAKACRAGTGVCRGCSRKSAPPTAMAAT